jgi:hypothetical protein
VSVWGGFGLVRCVGQSLPSAVLKLAEDATRQAEVVVTFEQARAYAWGVIEMCDLIQPAGARGEAAHRAAG